MKSSSSISRKSNLSKKDLEKQKLIEEKEKEAEVLQQFVETFEKPNTGLKTFVKGTTINGPVGAEQNAKNQIYKPSKLQELEEKIIKEQLIRESQAKQNVLSQQLKMDKPPKKKKVEKPKSNLELFKEELKMMQEEREGKLKDRSLFKNDGDKNPFKPGFKSQFGKDHSDLSAKMDDFNNKSHTFGSYDNGDPSTTNIYLGNISPKTTENDLMNLFGRYGPLASVKVMWPRTDEERARNRNCGFVAYMNRKDAERAMKFLNGKELDGYEMKLGWGKTVPLPPHPVYIPPKLREQLVPPPPSFLPFNAQPAAGDLDQLPPPGTSLAVLAKQENFGEILRNSTVKVVAPPDRTLLCLIHRMVEFVVREGPMFEAMIMNRELMNPMFRFLFDNQSPEHVYYRWRLFSVLQGEHHSKWRTESFRMFKDGPLWRPPPVNPFQQGMPDELIDMSPDRAASVDEQASLQFANSRGFKESKEKEKKGMLTDSEREMFEDMLRELTPERQKIQEAMIYCIEHADAAEEIVKCIVESLSLFETPLHKKIARLYLISDVLHNCTVKVSNASFYRKGFQAKLVDVFQNMHKCYESIEGRMKAEHFKQRVMNCFKAWEDWALYASEFLIKLQNIFLGLVKLDKSCDKPSDRKLDGLPIPLDDDDDVDGIPVDDVDGIPIDDAQIKFKVSKWESIIADDSVDGKPLTSKWDKLEENDDEVDIDGVPLEQAEDENSVGKSDEAAGKQNSPEFEQLKQSLTYLPEDERRKLLREVEMKVLKYQDDLDSGKEPRKKSLSLDDQVEEYRIKVLRRYMVSSQHSRSDRSERSDRSDRRRSSRSRSRSTSGGRRRRSYSRSPSSSRRYQKSPSRQSSDHRQRSKHRAHSRSPSSSRRSSRRSASRSPHRSPYRSKKK